MSLRILLTYRKLYKHSYRQCRHQWGWPSGWWLVYRFLVRKAPKPVAKEWPYTRSVDQYGAIQLTSGLLSGYIIFLVSFLHSCCAPVQFFVSFEHFSCCHYVREELVSLWFSDVPWKTLLLKYALIMKEENFWCLPIVLCTRSCN